MLVGQRRAYDACRGEDFSERARCGCGSPKRSGVSSACGRSELDTYGKPTLVGRLRAVASEMRSVHVGDAPHRIWEWADLGVEPLQVFPPTSEPFPRAGNSRCPCDKEPVATLRKATRMPQARPIVPAPADNCNGPSGPSSRGPGSCAAASCNSPRAYGWGAGGPLPRAGQKY